MIRELTTLRERQAAAALCRDWGYPRAISWLEIVHGRWWETPYGVGFLIEGGVQGDVLMHGCGRPGAGRRVISPELTKLVLRCAREMGAKRVIQPLQGGDYAGLRRLWVRAGWKCDEFGNPYMEVDPKLVEIPRDWAMSPEQLAELERELREQNNEMRRRHGLEVK